MAVGDRIKERREVVNMSQTELAEKAGISKQTLYKYENNIIVNIPSDKVEKIASILDTTPAYLMGWEDERLVFRCEIFNANRHYENQSKLLKYFENLNFIGEEEAIKRLEELTYIPKYTENQEPLLKEVPNSVKAIPIKKIPNAAHARTDKEPTPEGQAHDNAIMDDDSEWK